MSSISVCGWCITGHYDQCIKEIVYYDKTWVCASIKYQADLKAKKKKLAKAQNKNK